MSAHSRDKAYQDRLEHLKSEIAALNRQEVKNMTDDMVDKYCDPKNPVRVTFNDVSSAAFRIKGGMDVTPCTVRYLIDLSYLEKQISPHLSIHLSIKHSHMSAMTGMDIYLKKDFLLYTGSFKERGARNALLNLSKVNPSRI